jgi:general secretion pathway protein A
VAAYVRHRLEVAGTARQVFPPSLMGRIYRLSAGVPRLVNVICDRALLGAFVQGKEAVDASTLAKAAREVLPPPAARPGGRQLALAAVLALVAVFGLVVAVNPLGQRASAPPAPPAAPAPIAAETPPAQEPAQAPTTVTSDTGWPGDLSPSRSQTLAYTALFRAWGRDYAGGDACREAARQGLRCRTARSGLDELRQLNRPAVLVMRGKHGQEYYAALTGLGDDEATLALGEETRHVSLDALAEQWTGNYAMLWRLPPEASEGIKAGERGPVVAWLDRQLAQAQGRTADVAGDPVFDEALARRVKQFQLAEGLIPDGAVGPQTLMRLSSVGDRTAPVLARRAGHQ